MLSKLLLALNLATAFAFAENGIDENLTVRSSSEGELDTPSSSLTNKTKPFVVDGTKIPDVPFDIGESYAGTLPISTNQSDVNRLYFWYFPSKNPSASNEITIWLNGGPGCSSLLGLLQENGPFLWQPGTYSPKPNPFSWTRLTNMVYIDQPIGTGYSPAAPGAPANITTQTVIAQNFLAFWKNFITTFDLQGRKVYITGESYAGKYIPYISHAMLTSNDTKFFNVKGISITDPSINSFNAQVSAPAVGMVNTHPSLFGLNSTFLAHLNTRAQACGFDSFMSSALTFPPTRKQPPAPSGFAPGCTLWSDINEASSFVNPCYNPYHILDSCPWQWNVLGFPGLAWGPDDYFNRSDVKRAVNAPLGVSYEACGNPTLGIDTSPPSSWEVLPRVIEMTGRVVVGNGGMDFNIPMNGTLGAIQNMTWNGKQGFQARPSEGFFVPYYDQLVGQVKANQHWPTFTGGAGVLGTTHTERGLTFFTVDRSGHEIPQYAPGAAYRQLEFLLGRINSLTQQGGFTTPPGP